MAAPPRLLPLALAALTLLSFSARPSMPSPMAMPPVPLRASYSSRLLEQQFPTLASGQMSRVKTPVDVLHVPPHTLFVSSFMENEVLRIDTRDPALTPRVFAKGVHCLGDGGMRQCSIMDGPWGLAHRDGVLYVSSFGSDQIMLFDVATGEYLGAFGNEEELNCPEGIAFSRDGSLLYVVSYLDNRVVRYDVSGSAFPRRAERAGRAGSLDGCGGGVGGGGGSKQGGGRGDDARDSDRAQRSGGESTCTFPPRTLLPTYEGVLVEHDAGLLSPEDVLVLPGSGHLLVSSYGTNNVQQFLPNGTFVEVFAGNGSAPPDVGLAEDSRFFGGRESEVLGRIPVDDDASPRKRTWHNPEGKKEKMLTQKKTKKIKTANTVERGGKGGRGGRDRGRHITEDESGTVPVAVEVAASGAEEEVEVAEVEARGGGNEYSLSGPVGLALANNGRDVLVSSYKTNQVLRYDRETRTFLGTYASGAGMRAPSGMCVVDDAKPDDAADASANGAADAAGGRPRGRGQGRTRGGSGSGLNSFGRGFIASGQLLVATYDAHKILVYETSPGRRGASLFQHAI